MGDFRQFLILEQQEFLAQKLGDIVTALQSLANDSNNTNNRNLLQWTKNIVMRMRDVLSSNWSRAEMPYLQRVQAVAVALAKAIDNNDKMPEVIASAKTEMERIQQKLGYPVHQLGNVEKPKTNESAIQGEQVILVE